MHYQQCNNCGDMFKYAFVIGHTEYQEFVDINGNSVGYSSVQWQGETLCLKCYAKECVLLGC